MTDNEVFKTLLNLNNQNKHAKVTLLQSKQNPDNQPEYIQCLLKITPKMYFEALGVSHEAKKNG